MAYGVGMRICGAKGHGLRAARALDDSRGIALITTIFIVFAVGMMLFAFVFMIQSEVGFAALNRNSTEALNLAEAGAAEAVARMNMFGATPGATTFTNSLASSTASSGSTGTVSYQATLQTNPSIFPILSTATFAKIQRRVRLFVQVSSRTGFGNIIYGRQDTFTADASLTTGDVYARTSVAFTNNPPLCAAGATATTLVGTQIVAGTTIGTTKGVTSTPCGQPIPNVGNPGYSTECASASWSMTEVAPTSCPGGGRAAISGNVIPPNWHPLAPIGMGSTDFATLITWINANPTTAANDQLSAPQATQGGTGVTYSSAGTYTPSYWSSVPTTNGKVMLVMAGQPFCVNPSAHTVYLPSPLVTGACASNDHYYGNQTNNQALTTRFLDWGLVTDDLSRRTATTFFQSPTCTTCNNGGSNGNQNGIRYVPLPPTINVLAQACQQNVNPGTTVFDSMNGVPCSNPAVQVISQSSVTFTGTKSAPEALIIDNAGQPAAQITPSIHGNNTLTCSNTNFDNYSWGIILATGDVNVPANIAFTGYIYTPGNVTITGASVIRGGIFSANTQGTSNQDIGGGGQGQVDVTATADYCGGSNANLLTLLFSTFQTISWQDVPLNKP